MTWYEVNDVGIVIVLGYHVQGLLEHKHYGDTIVDVITEIPTKYLMGRWHIQNGYTWQRDDLYPQEEGVE
jgi:hypothetical protein